MHHHDDSVGKYLAVLRPGPDFVSLYCPDCPRVVFGKDVTHAAELLAIHQEGTCQGGKGVGGDGASDPAPDSPATDALRVTR